MESGAEVAGQPSLMAPDARVRGVSTRVVAVISEAAEQSQTFRGLVEEIGTTDGIVYVAEGECGHGVRACLLVTMTLAGQHRVLRILVDPRKADRDLMVSIGHELQHAVEVLSNVNLTNYSAMQLFYNQRCRECGHRFETDAAIRAGDAVRAELRSSAVTERREEWPAEVTKRINAASRPAGRCQRRSLRQQRR
jgi:hypothetical protein